MNNIFLINPDTIRENAYIDDNINTKDIETAILIAQDTKLELVLGTVLYDKILNDVDKDTLTGDYKELVENQIKDFIEWATIQEIVKVQLFRIGNRGLVRDNVTNSDNTNLSEITFLISQLEGYSKAYESRLIDHLQANTSKFPEYNKEIDGGIDPKEDAGSLIVFDWTLLDE